MTNRTLKERVYNDVLSSIISGEYTVDSVLNENKLCEKLGVSKSPVREALVELCSEGILQSVPRLGYTLVRFDHADLNNLLDFRVLLECGCLESCFDRITPTQLLRLDTIVDNEFLFLTGKDTRAYWNGTLDFHLTLASFSENEYIFNHLNQVLSTCMRAYLQLYWNRFFERGGYRPSALHLKIIQSIRDHRREDAIRCLKNDIETLRTF